MTEIMMDAAFVVGWTIGSALLFFMIMTWPWMRFALAVAALVALVSDTPLAAAQFASVAVLGGMALYLEGRIGND